MMMNVNSMPTEVTKDMHNLIWLFCRYIVRKDKLDDEDEKEGVAYIEQQIQNLTAVKVNERIKIVTSINVTSNVSPTVEGKLSDGRYVEELGESEIPCEIKTLLDDHAASGITQRDELNIICSNAFELYARHFIIYDDAEIEEFFSDEYDLFGHEVGGSKFSKSQLEKLLEATK